ncbi:MAG: hypothetical protein IJ219_08550 [Bacteroidaceae bacterium]|nr:hypothetical protein [Bacteroidaceae bacterium]
MKKLLFTLLLAAAVLPGWADEYYLVGDGTSIGWEGDGTKRQPMRMAEKSEGVYAWTGLLKQGGEGFKICKSSGGWDGYHPSVEAQPISGTGSGTITENNGDDWKWNPENTDWQWFTITLDKNAGTLSWNQDFTPLTADTDGYINIGTAEELNKLAIMSRSNVNEESWNVRLTADIDYTAYTDGCEAAIANVEYCPFRGDFDGQGHTITVDMKAYWTRFSLFGTIAGSVHDLKVAGKITATDKNQIGGICGLLRGNGNKIYNCISAVEIVDNQSGDGTIGGICAVTYDATTIKNCAFYGKISAPNRDGSAGIVGWDNNGTDLNIVNCLVVAETNWKEGSNNTDFGRNNPSLTNCFRVDATDADLANGQMTYKLNSFVSGGEDWFQTLGTDALPTPFSTSQKIYANGTFYCDGVTSKGGDIVLSNTDESVIDPHVFGEDAVCTGCHAVGQEPLKDGDNYLISKAGHMLWWAQYVNAGNTEARAILQADIDLTNAKYTPAGTTDYVFKGQFTGNNHSVTLALNKPELSYQGLFGVVTDGVWIEGVIVKGFVTGSNFVAGIVGGTNGGSGNAKQTNIWNCGNEATITASGANGGGIIGVNMSGSASIIITNCYNTGNVTSGREAGAISGWLGGGWSSVRNCYNTGTVKNGSNTSKAFGRNNGCFFTNCYASAASGTDNSTEDTGNGKPTIIDNAAVASGELCYKLGDADGNAFSQFIGTDAYPTFGNNPVNYIGEAGYATLYDTTTGYELNGDVKAYVATLNKTWLDLTEVENVPEATPVVLRGTYYNKLAADLPAINVANDLKGTDADTAADGTMYVLAKVDEKVGFYKATGTIAAGKAYYQSTSGVKAFYFDGDDATGISEVESSKLKVESPIYNIAGQRVSKMQKGINIINGKKVLF